MVTAKLVTMQWVVSPKCTNQYSLDLVLAALDVVHDHVREDVLTVLQLVHLVIRVGVQNRPAKELGQRLEGGRDIERHVQGNPGGVTGKTRRGMMC